MSARLGTRSEVDAIRADLIARYGNFCQLCGAAPKSRALSVDHDHKTKAVRGLLCHACNRRLWPGCTVAWLEQAIRYLKAPPP